MTRDRVKKYTSSEYNLLHEQMLQELQHGTNIQVTYKNNELVIWSSLGQHDPKRRCNNAGIRDDDTSIMPQIAQLFVRQS